ncbi:MAG TPA: SAVED domain-containing protein [Thermoanaerobaculia bacterium]
MTDPTGRSFLSYRRSCLDDADLLIAAQREHGIPTWRDVDDLPGTPTEEEIRRVLADEQTASAVLWLTGDVESSPMIRRTEGRLILDRARRSDGFFVVPVAARGLGYAKAGELLGPPYTAEDLSGWNLCSFPPGPIGPREAAQIAEKVLRGRLQALHRSLPKDDPIRLQLYTRERAPFRPGKIALSLDWSGRFEGREARPGAWENHILPALRRVAVEIAAQAHARAVEAEGLAALPAVAALGCAFLLTRGIALSWKQHMAADGTTQLWNLRAVREASGFEGRTTPANIRATDLAVLLSVTESVDGAFQRSMADLPPFRAVCRVSKAGKLPHSILSPGQAVDVARTVIESIKEARRDHPEIQRVHLLMAGPAGIALMIGQLLNTLGAVQTYELVGGTAGGHYRPAALLDADKT